MDSTRPGKWLYDDRVVTNETPLSIAQQIVTEKLLDNLSDEVPYQIKIVSLLVISSNEFVM